VQDYPDASRKGIITAIYYLGTWLSYVLISHPLSDFLGRRYGALAGTAVVCVGAALQAGCTGSSAFAMMVAGRIISGIGVAIISTSVPLYQT
jgi:MFS family permease